MKRVVLLLLPLCLLSGTSRADTQIGTWNMTINGTVLPSSCDVDADSQNQTVQLGKISSSVFSSVGATSPNTPVSIKLTGCTNATGVKVTFSGNADADNPQLLALSDTGGGGTLATGVGVEVMNSDNTAIPLNSPSSQFTLKDGDNTLSFLLHYKATKMPVTGGSATAVVYFDMSYQ